MASQSTAEGRYKSPVKIVRWELEEDDDDDENVNETNVVVNIKAKGLSPRKKRRPSATTEMLEAELNAEARRRSSMCVGGLVDEDTLSQMVSSLRRQNEDLRTKLAGLEANSSTSSSSGANSSQNLVDRVLIDMKEKECEDMRTTIERLERLLNLEREERSVAEKKTLELLGNVKAKWHSRDEQRMQKLRKDLDMANSVVQDMELELAKSGSDLQAARDELTSLQSVKGSLKAKLKECKGKLEATVANYDAKSERVNELERHLASLEAQLAERKKVESDSKRKASIAETGHAAQLAALKEDMAELAAQKRRAESELAESRSAAKTLGSRVESLLRELSELKREHADHVSKCDAHLVRLKSENDGLRERNDELSTSAADSEAKLAAKTNDLARLEKILGELEQKIPTRERLSEMAETKANEKLGEQAAVLDDLQQRFSLQKVELRIAEKKAAEHKERLDFVRAMYVEEKGKREVLEAQTTSTAESKLALESELEAERRTTRDLRERVDSLNERAETARKQLAELRRDADANARLANDVEGLEKRLAGKASELDKLAGVAKKYELTKNVCLELEDQVKEYEAVIGKLEAAQDALKATNGELKEKADKAAEELIKAKREANELKSTHAFAETRVRDLEEKNRDIEKFYESEGATWKVKFEEASKVRREQTSTIVGLEDDLGRIEADRNRNADENKRLHEQNSKLKEEMSTLITSIHSLKESNLMLQSTVQELADKLTARDDELDRKSAKLAELGAELDRKTVEHKETLSQLKKLTLHIPPSTPNSKRKDKHLL